MARPTKLMPEVQERIAEALRMGATHKHAAHYAGISEPTFYRWMEENQEFQEFINAREGEAALYLMTLIGKAAKTDWRAASWILEHRWAQDYAKSRIDIHHSGEVKVSVDLLATLRMAIEQAFPDNLEIQERLADALSVVESAQPQIPNIRPRGPRSIARERKEREEAEAME